MGDGYICVPSKLDEIMSHQGETQIASVLRMINMMAGSLGWGGEEEGWRKGPWTGEEDKLLIEYVRVHGEGRWNSVARLAGLKRNGKSCRLRWVNYLRPDLKRGQITPHEESLIMELHAKWGNRWSTIARSLPGRTDNEIKNYWRTHFKKSGKSSQNSDKAKSIILKRQQQKKLLMQQQLQQRQQQEQQFQIDHIQDQGDLQYFQTLIKAMGSDISSQLQDQEVGDQHNHGVVSIPHHEYYRPEMAFNLINPMLTGTNTSLDQCCLSPIYQGGICGVADHGLAEEGIWGSLWNLDDGNNCGSMISKGAIQIANFYPEYII